MNLEKGREGVRGVAIAIAAKSETARKVWR